MQRFDWRDYAEVIPFGADALDATTPDLRAVNAFKYNQQVSGLIEEVIQQMAQTVEVQHLLRTARELAPDRMRRLGASADRQTDPRLFFVVQAEGNPAYNPFKHIVHVGLNPLLNYSYSDAETPFSLQRILFHELRHTNDRIQNRLDEEHLEIAHLALKKAADRTAVHFPETQDELRERGALAGINVDKLRSASDWETFKTLCAGSMAWDLNGPRPNMKRLEGALKDADGVARQFADAAERSASAGEFFAAAFKEAFDDTRFDRQEKHVMAAENYFMNKYYREPYRHSYYTKGDDDATGLHNTRFDILMETVRRHIHPAIRADIPLAQPHVIQGVVYDKEVMKSRQLASAPKPAPF